MAATRIVNVQAVSQMRVDDILGKHRELAQRISLALDPDLIMDSDIDANTLKSLQKELDVLQERTDTEDMQDLLRRHGLLDEIRAGFAVMTERLQSRRVELDPDYEFPSSLLASTPRRSAGQPAPQAGPSRIRGLGGGRVLTGAGPGMSSEGLQPASGPHRGTPSIREARDQANAPPSIRPRLSLPSDCQTFDVVFLPFKYDRSMQLPDPALCAAQLCLRNLGLVFEVKLPRQGPVKSFFDSQVKSFCEDKKLHLQSGVNPKSPVWTLMAVRKLRNKYDLHAELPASHFTTQTLGGPPFNKVRNYLSEHSANQVLLIAPMHADLKGAINLPDVSAPQLKHQCHVSRLDAAVQERVGKCNSRCELDTGSSSRHGTGRTLAQ
ncbi:hypothetical protein K438DRAFT_1830758 [Mycena galopus ATCC 62051]|nr:hypothetical protein K438DRAFT_1830758 [Mycena galopus ATCC 62051]